MRGPSDFYVEGRDKDEPADGPWVPKVNPMMAHLEKTEDVDKPDYDLLQVLPLFPFKEKKCSETSGGRIQVEGRGLDSAARVRRDAVEPPEALAQRPEHAEDAEDAEASQVVAEVPPQSQHQQGITVADHQSKPLPEGEGKQDQEAPVEAAQEERRRR